MRGIIPDKINNGIVSRVAALNESVRCYATVVISAIGIFAALLVTIQSSMKSINQNLAVTSFVVITW